MQCTQIWGRGLFPSGQQVLSVIPAFLVMNEIHDAADGLELITEDEYWPLPKMRELLFTR